MDGIEDSKLSVVSPLHLGKGGEPPVASPSMPPPAAAETEPVSAPSPATITIIERRKLNRGRKGGRVRVVASRVSADEYTALDLKARETGLSIGSYLRATALGAPGP